MGRRHSKQARAERAVHERAPGTLTLHVVPQAGGIGSEGLTYAERQTLGYGTSRERLGKACCCERASAAPLQHA